MVMAREGDQSLTLDCDEGFDFAEALDDVYGKEKAPADLLYVFETSSMVRKKARLRPSKSSKRLLQPTIKSEQVPTTKAI